MPNPLAPPSGGLPGTPEDHRAGLLFGIGSYLIWGVLPLYFTLLDPAGPVEIVAERIIWSLLLCLILLVLNRGFGRFTALLRTGRTMALLTAASLFIAGNWLTFTYGVEAGRLVEISLGYFINPLITVLFGVIFLKERLNALQWSAMGIGTAAVVVIGIDYGRVPWLALAVAFTFSIYGLLKNRAGRGAGALEGLSLETLVLTAPAAVYVIWLEASGAGSFLDHGPGHSLLMAGLGVITAVPLLLFGAAARRVPLSWIGMLQYIAPILQFVFGLTVFQEHMPLVRWIGFGLVWLALVVLTGDVLRRRRRSAAARLDASARASG